MIKVEFKKNKKLYKTNLSDVPSVLCVIYLKVVQWLQLGGTKGQKFTLSTEKSSKSHLDASIRAHQC